MPGLLTTHVLDTARGRPAANLQLQLFRLDPPNDRRSLLKEVRTNVDGRTERASARTSFGCAYRSLCLMSSHWFAVEVRTSANDPLSFSPRSRMLSLPFAISSLRRSSASRRSSNA